MFLVWYSCCCEFFLEDIINVPKNKVKTPINFFLFAVSQKCFLLLLHIVNRMAGKNLVEIGQVVFEKSVPEYWKMKFSVNEVWKVTCFLKHNVQLT